MNKAFEKILDRLEEKAIPVLDEDEHIIPENNIREPYEIGMVALSDVNKIVQEVAEEYNNGWIPCSERLPEEDDTLYLVSYKKIFFDKSFYFYDIAYLYTFPNGNRYWVSAKSDNVRQVSKVSAWQPLPEQYKEG